MKLLPRTARESGLRPPRWLSAVARVLGGVYLAAGLAKLPVLGAFTGTVAGILSGYRAGGGPIFHLPAASYRVGGGVSTPPPTGPAPSPAS